MRTGLKKTVQSALKNMPIRQTQIVGTVADSVFEGEKKICQKIEQRSEKNA
jgi:hypothetical protein